MANKAGVNTSTIINIKKQRSKYLKVGSATIGNEKLKCYYKDYKLKTITK